MNSPSSTSLLGHFRWPGNQHRSGAWWRSSQRSRRTVSSTSSLDDHRIPLSSLRLEQNAPKDRPLRSALSTTALLLPLAFSALQWSAAPFAKTKFPSMTSSPSTLKQTAHQYYARLDGHIGLKLRSGPRETLQSRLAQSLGPLLSAPLSSTILKSGLPSLSCRVFLADQAVLATLPAPRLANPVPLALHLSLLGENPRPPSSGILPGASLALLETVQECHHWEVEQALWEIKLAEAEAAKPGILVLQDGTKLTPSMRYYRSFEQLERGQAEGGDPFTGGRPRRTSSETHDRFSSFRSSQGRVEITNYGYSQDHTPDTNSNYWRTGLGGTRPLIPGVSAALSKSMVKKLGALPGAVIGFLDGRGQIFLVTNDDRSPQPNLNIDVFRPTYGSNYFRGHVAAAMLIRQGTTSIPHNQRGMLFSLQNYRAAMAELIAQAQPVVSPSPMAEAKLDEFARVSTILPRTRELDIFADRGFCEDSFHSSRQLGLYLEAGTQVLRDGVSLAKIHGVDPFLFPPLLRIRENLKQGQVLREAMLEEETKLQEELVALEGTLLEMELGALDADTSSDTANELKIQVLEAEQRREEIRCSLFEHDGSDFFES
ncbi:MAG: hypothetical protein AAGJ31_04730 [Verrucomicrobiota bacterium]